MHESALPGCTPWRRIGPRTGRGNRPCSRSGRESQRTGRAAHAPSDNQQHNSVAGSMARGGNCCLVHLAQDAAGGTNALRDCSSAAGARRTRGAGRLACCVLVAAELAGQARGLAGRRDEGASEAIDAAGGALHAQRAARRARRARALRLLRAESADRAEGAAPGARSAEGSRRTGEAERAGALVGEEASHARLQSQTQNRVQGGETSSKSRLKASYQALCGACSGSELAENALLARRLASALMEPSSWAGQAPS